METKIEVEVSPFGKQIYVLRKPDGKVRTLTDTEYHYLKNKIKVELK